jgi:hypothetical protein
MTPPEAVERLNVVLAHLWMIRTFLKHADDIQDDEELLEVPRMLYDSIRAVEPAYLRGDYPDYLRRLKGKLPKLRKLAEFFGREYKRVSAHTNFEMASLSLSGSVRQMEEIFSQLVTEVKAMETDETPSKEVDKLENQIITD